jgi:hypothetical protein
LAFFDGQKTDGDGIALNLENSSNLSREVRQDVANLLFHYVNYDCFPMMKVILESDIINDMCSSKIVPKLIKIMISPKIDFHIRKLACAKFLFKAQNYSLEKIYELASPYLFIEKVFTLYIWIKAYIYSGMM